MATVDALGMCLYLIFRVHYYTTYTYNECHESVYIHIGVGSVLLVQTDWAISGPQSVERATVTDSTLSFYPKVHVNTSD